MYLLDNTEIEEPVARVKFACDLIACKGACCTLQGGRGAPLLEEELDEIDRAYPIMKNYLPQEHREVIERNGLYEGKPPDYTTSCINNRACVFVYYENSIAKCSFERAFLEGRLRWRKPISCHLFPIRIDHGFTERMRYERISECDPALARGAAENISLNQFLSESLQRRYGQDWYKRFLALCKLEREKINNNVGVIESASK